MQHDLPIPAEGWRIITRWNIARAMHINEQDVEIINDEDDTDAIYVLGEHFGDMDYMAGIEGEELQRAIDHFYKVHPDLSPSA